LVYDSILERRKRHRRWPRTAFERRFKDRGDALGAFLEKSRRFLPRGKVYLSLTMLPGFRDLPSLLRGVVFVGEVHRPVYLTLDALPRIAADSFGTQARRQSGNSVRKALVTVVYFLGFLAFIGVALPILSALLFLKPFVMLDGWIRRAIDAPV
jgi:hypothetical protein